MLQKVSALLFLSIICFSCRQPPETTIYNLEDGQVYNLDSDPIRIGKGEAVKFFGHSVSPYNDHSDFDKEVTTNINEFISNVHNNGYKIVSISLTRCSSGHILKAKIYYK